MYVCGSVVIDPSLLPRERVADLNGCRSVQTLCNRANCNRRGGERRALAGHGTSALASAPMRDSPACTLRAVWDAARRPDAPVRRPRPARRRRSLQQLRGAFMATPSCSPRRRRRGNRDRGRPTRLRLHTTIGAGPGRRRAGALRVVRCLDSPAVFRSIRRQGPLRDRRPAHNAGVVTWCRRRR